ncbi:MAG: class I SAM-dependent methyltransferase [Pseudomonadota bacterium]
MSDFVIDVKASIAAGFDGFFDLANEELSLRAGSVDKSRYQAVRGALKDAVLKDAARAKRVLGQVIDTSAALKDLNAELYFVFFEQFIDAILHDPGLFDTSALGDRAPSLEMFEALESALSQEVKRHGAHNAVLFWSGVLYHLRGDAHSAAQNLRAAVRSENPSYSLPHYLSGAKSVIERAEFIKIGESKRALTDPLSFALQSSDGPQEMVLFSCCDDAYFRALSGRFLSSLNALNLKLCVHIHIACREERDTLDLDFSAYENLSVDISISDASGVVDRTWFTLLRWLLVMEVIEHYDTRVLVTDFDVEFDGSKFATYLTETENYDLGLNLNPFPNRRFPWTSVNANQLLFNKTAPAKQFAGLLKDFTETVFSGSRTDQWWMDQNVLYAAFRVMQSSRDPARIYNNFRAPIKATMYDKKALLAAKRDDVLVLPVPKAEQTVFTQIYKDHAWAGGDETRSGSGSTLQSTKNTVPLLAAFLADHKIRDLVDVGCGDGHWMLKIIPDLLRYRGFDIVPDLIASNTERARELGLGNASYGVLNPVEAAPPKGDAILFRDVAIHLPNEMIIACLKNFATSSSTYLITTEFPDEPDTSAFHARMNGPVRLGGYRRIDYSMPPFALPPPIARIPDNVVLTGDVVSEDHANRVLSVYRMDDIAARIEAMDVTERQASV